MRRTRRYSAILALGWVLVALFYLSQSGEMFHSFHQNGQWLAILIGLYFLVRLSAVAIYAVRRAIRAGDPEMPEDQ